jgi:ketosteroid isomerase-like protein
MQEHPHAALVRKAIEGMNTGDFGGQMELLADDVVWHEIGSDEPVRGKDALMARFAAMPVPEGGGFSVDIHDVVANDEHTIALATATATMGDQSFTYRTAEIMHVRDGKVTERWAFSDDTERITRFFAQSRG